MKQSECDQSISGAVVQRLESSLAYDRNGNGHNKLGGSVNPSCLHGFSQKAPDLF